MKTEIYTWYTFCCEHLGESKFNASSAPIEIVVGVCISAQGDACGINRKLIAMLSYERAEPH